MQPARDETMNTHISITGDPMAARQSFALELVRSALANVAPGQVDELDQLDNHADVWRALNLDSMDHVTVMIQIAEATGSDIPERDYPRLLSLGQLCDHVARAVR
jgi:acyl carrier protein